VAEKRLPYRRLLACAKRFGVEEVPGRGKGSERLWKRASYTCPMTCHGEGYEIGKGLARAMRRRLRLTANDGISDDDFYRDA